MYRFHELGWLQFETLCTELLALEARILPSEWDGRADRGRSTTVEAGLQLDGSLPGPTAVHIGWVRPGEDASARVDWSFAGGELQPRSVMLLTNVEADRVDVQAPSGAAVRVLGARELGAMVDARPELRRRVPFVLGVRDLDDLVDGEAARRSATDVDAAVALARVFVPTRAYMHTLDVLDRHRFAVLTGPPEMGKTAIARMLGLAALTSGWEVHECTRPDELWTAFERDRRQLFVADDAFGSTEYRPEAAERWAQELDRVLRAMDDRHILVWTSRPAPLRAGLRRIQREHGIERFPQPAEVQVAASDLDVEEKAVILFRHAKAAGLPSPAVSLVREHAWTIVDHAHFTPERIRRFVSDRLPVLPPDAVVEAVQLEIREPTPAMAASLRALGPEHRALLIGMLDAPPGPVPERDLAAAVRRLDDGGLPRAPGELVDRLTDHFVRVVPPNSVTWVHPSWRDLLIDELAQDPGERRRFLSRCGVEGVLLALSIGGGAMGERAFPLLLDDQDWDTVNERVYALVPELDDTDTFRLLASLGEALADEPDGRLHAEAEALAAAALSGVCRSWNAKGAAIPVALLEAWLALAARLSDPPVAPDVTPTWIELLPVEQVDTYAPSELARLDDWLATAEVLAAHAPSTLSEFGFPERQAAILDELVADAAMLGTGARDTDELLARSLRRLARLDPQHAQHALMAVWALVHPTEPEPLPELPYWPPQPTAPVERSIVARVLRDLEPPPAL
jgi:hypothetical protein